MALYIIMYLDFYSAARSIWILNRIYHLGVYIYVCVALYIVMSLDCVCLLTDKGIQ